MKQLTVKERIEKEFGSLNKFVDQNYYNLGMSRTHLYALLNQDKHCNPSIGMLIKLSELTNIPEEDIFREYSMRYRNGQPDNQHSN